jgi:hypothetical protein
MHEQIAKTYKIYVACPISISTCARVVVEAAWEDIQAGQAPNQAPPFWRVIQPNSNIAKKSASGSEFIEEIREQEGV